MVTETKQKSAKAWGDSLVSLNKARPGMVQICYQNEQGNKMVGYIDLFDIELIDNGESVKLGDRLISLQKSVNDTIEENKLLKNENTRLLERNKVLDKQIGDLWDVVFPDAVRL